MTERVRSALAYTTLLLTCIAGIVHASWWAASGGACLLVINSILSRQFATARHGIELGAPADQTLALSSILNGAVIASAAFVLGKFAGWVWGF